MDTYQRSGLRFDVAEVGPAHGPVVVCLHGFPQDGTAYTDVAGTLAAAGCRVLMPDQRGYSPGARPTSPTQYAMPELVADAVALLDAAGAPRAHVVGHDWGGAVAWSLAAARPQRLHSLTVLSTPHPAAMARGAVEGTQALRSSYMALFQLPWVPEQLALAGGARGLRGALERSGLPAGQAEHYVERMSEPRALTCALNWYRAMTRAPKAVPRAPGAGAARMTAIATPTTFLTGSNDPFFARASVEATASRVSGPYEHRDVPAGHWLPETRPDDVAEAVLRHVRAVQQP